MEEAGDGMTGNESYLAGAILIDAASVLPVIQGLVKPDDFQIEAYRTVFTAAASLAADGEPVDPVSIQARARKQGVDLSNQLLTELMEVVPTCTNAADYAHRVAEDARVRQIKELATRIQEDSVSSPDELLATLQREAEDIRGSSYRRGLLSPADTLHRFNDLVVKAGAGQDNFVPSGFHRLDEILGGGFIRSGLYILGARPAMGKSTFAVNLADNIDGNVLLVSLEMKKISSESLYDIVSMIQQNVFVFNASIRNNITMFREFPTAEVDRAIELSGLSTLIAERGEDYLCGENGSGLSGGEKQRISIARSLLKHASVLLADEATAALDAQTAHQVTDDILSLTGVTRIVVTHTLEQAALRRYDGILVLKNGRIAESGTFDALMARKGYFYALYTVSQ